MIEGKSGAREYEYNGIIKYLSFAPVKGTDWSLAITTPEIEVLSGLDKMRYSGLIASVISLLGGLIIAYFIAKIITTPIKIASEHMMVVATGDFTTEIPEKFMKSKDEIGVLAKAIGAMQQSMKEVVKGVINQTQRLW